jgi:hypothetical protein
MQIYVILIKHMKCMCGCMLEWTHASCTKSVLCTVIFYITVIVPHVKGILYASLVTWNMGPHIECILYAASFKSIPFLMHGTFMHL